MEFAKFVEKVKLFLGNTWMEKSVIHVRVCFLEIFRRVQRLILLTNICVRRYLLKSDAIINMK